MIATDLLPSGVRHYNTQGFAESWDAYDALGEEDGWEEQVFLLDAQGHDAARSGRMALREHRSKRLALAAGGELIVYPPVVPRSEVSQA